MLANQEIKEKHLALEMQELAAADALAAAEAAELADASGDPKAEESPTATDAGENRGGRNRAIAGAEQACGIECCATRATTCAKECQLDPQPVGP